MFAKAASDQCPSARQNFACTVLEAQTDGSSDGGDGRGPSPATFDQLNLAFTVFFSAELALHAAAYWLRPFLTAWSCLARSRTRSGIVEFSYNFLSAFDPHSRAPSKAALLFLQPALALGVNSPTRIARRASTLKASGLH